MPEPAKGGAMIRLTFDTQWFHASFQPPDCRTYSTEVTCKKQQSPVSSHTTPIQALGYHITKIPWCQGDFSIFFNFFEMRFLPQLDTSGFGSDWAGPRCFFAFGENSAASDEVPCPEDGGFYALDVSLVKCRSISPLLTDAARAFCPPPFCSGRLHVPFLTEQLIE